MPIRPSSPMRRTVSRGKRASRSMASAIGRTSLSAKSLATAWIIFCSSVSSMCIPFLDLELNRPQSTRHSPRRLPRLRLVVASQLEKLFLKKLFEFLLQEGRDFEEVAYDAVVGDLEDRRFRILVDGADHFRRPHAREMLDGAGDAEAQVELRRDGASGLADLEPVRPPAGVHGRARGADGRADHFRERFQDDEVLGPLEPPPAGHHDLRLRELWQARRRFFTSLYETHRRRGHRDRRLV